MKLNELHDHLFEVLCVIDDICKKNNTSYYLDSGTLLGAVREGDFIPWDDDLDIKVLAEDYPAFKAALEKDLPSYMHIVEPDVFLPNFYDFIVRIYDDRYMVRKENAKDTSYNNIDNYVGTDVFIMAPVPNEKIGKKMIFNINVLYGMAMSRRSGIEWDKYSGMQKISVAFLTTIGKLASVKSLCKKMEKMRNKYNADICNYRLKLNVPLQYLKLYPEHIYDGKALVKIRDREFPAVKGYEKELEIMYGTDWRTPRKEGFIKHIDEEDSVDN